MSTASSGLNEFPVLLRLPDLNATVWVPLPTAPPAPAPAASSSAEPVANTAAPAIAVSTLPTPALGSTAAATKAPLVVDGPKLKTTATSPAASPPSPAPLPKTTATATPLPTTASTAPTLLSRVEGIARMAATVASQHTVIRQLATGGALVGGLALTYFLIMGGGSDVTPDHISSAETTLEPPVIETGSSLATSPSPGPVVVRPEVPAGNIIADVPPPPDFGRDWQTAPAKPTHIEVAETTQQDVPTVSTPPDFSRSQPAIPPRDESYRFEGRVGPESSALHAPTYPTTDPATFQFRPVTDPREHTRVNTAKLEGTIAPPPLR